MDTQSRDVFQQLFERLEKIENQQQKLDRVMERLDTLQNILERQNKKHNLLDEKLVAMTAQFQHEKANMAEELREALQENVQPICAIGSQEECTQTVHKAIQPLQSLDAQYGDKLKSIDDRTVDTAQKCHQLTSWSQQLDDKMKELAGKNIEITKTFLVEMRSVKDLIKGQTNSELIWLNNQIDGKLSEIGLIVRSIHEQQNEMKEGKVRSMVQVVKTDGKQQGKDTHESLIYNPKLSTDMCDKQLQAIQDLDRKMEQLNTSVQDVGREIKTSLNSTMTANEQSKIDLENTIRNSLAGMIDKSKEHSDLISTKMKSDLNDLFEESQQKTEGLTDDLKEYIHETKREIFAVTEKEAQIVRDRIQGPLPSLGKYTFDFYVNNFTTLIRSGKRLHSMPWYINELQTCVSGFVIMSSNGKMEVWLHFGRHPREVGLQSRSIKLGVKATVCDINERKLPALHVGVKNFDFDEASITWNGGQGCEIGVKSCDMLVQKGYGKKEDYDQEALLIRYEVTVQ